MKVSSDFCSGNGQLTEVRKGSKGRDVYVISVSCDCDGTAYASKAYRTWFYFKMEREDGDEEQRTIGIKINNLNKQVNSDPPHVSPQSSEEQGYGESSHSP